MLLGEIDDSRSGVGKVKDGSWKILGTKVVLRKVSGCDKRTQKPARGSPWITQGQVSSKINNDNYNRL